MSNTSLSDAKPSHGFTKLGCARSPICAEPTPSIRRLEGWGYWCKCAGCDLEFAQPMTLPERSEEMFAHAYQGEREESGMRKFAYRLSIRSALLQDHEAVVLQSQLHRRNPSPLKLKVSPSFSVWSSYGRLPR